MRKKILVFLTHKVGMPYFRLTRTRSTFRYTSDELAALGKETVGFRLHSFWNDNHLTLLPFYEKHDIKHIILDYPPDEKGEVCLQCFMLANGRWTFPVLLAVIFGWLTMPEYWPEFIKSMKRGKNNISLSDCDWLSLIEENFSEIKNQLIKYKK